MPLPAYGLFWEHLIKVTLSLNPPPSLGEGLEKVAPPSPSLGEGAGGGGLNCSNEMLPIPAMVANLC